MSNVAYLYVVGTILCTVYGQLVLKWRIANYGVLPESLWAKFTFLLGLLVDPYIFSGFAAAFAASLFWMAAMTRLDLSVAYPFVSASFALVMLFSIVLLGESLTLHKVAGIVLICTGIVVVSQSR